MERNNNRDLLHAIQNEINSKLEGRFTFEIVDLKDNVILQMTSNNEIVYGHELNYMGSIAQLYGLIWWASSYPNNKQVINMAAGQ